MNMNQIPQTDPNYPDEDVPRQKQWESEFPYHWDADELTSRRDLLQFAVYASGTLFLGTAFLALLRRFLPKRKTAPQEIARIAEIPNDEAAGRSRAGRSGSDDRDVAAWPSTLDPHGSSRGVPKT